METKTIIFSFTKEIKTKKEKEKVKRKITMNSQWKSNVPLTDQLFIIEYVYSMCGQSLPLTLLSLSPTLPSLSPTLPTDELNERVAILKIQINKKLTGYKYQDIHNHFYNESLFVNFNKVIELLHHSNLCCYYCQNNVDVFYENVREPNQWTLERLDNKRGHNCDNLVISCLKCNLRRRTMFPERFLFTKKIGRQEIIKLP
jgi:hypothetical protein